MTLNEIKRIVDQILVDYPDKDIAVGHITEFILGIKNVEKECEVCKGIGHASELDGDGYGGEVICLTCNGTGKIYEDINNEDYHPRHPDNK